jgi:hypothetical protein
MWSDRLFCVRNYWFTMIYLQWYMPYIEPIRNLRLGARQAKKSTSRSEYYKYYRYPDRGVVPRQGYHFTGYPDRAVQPDSYYKYPDRGVVPRWAIPIGLNAWLFNLRKWPTHDTRKFPNVTINRIRILPTKFAFKDHSILKILTR